MSIKEEFEALGISVDIREKDKEIKTAINSAFFKTETIWKEIVLENIVKQMGIKSNRPIKIKIKIDKKPPQQFETEQKLLLRPFSLYVNCFTLSSLFAGKIHALLFRKWKNRVKGRDWYDVEWYIRKNIPLNLKHFAQHAIETNDWDKPTMSEDEFMGLLHDKIKVVSIENVKEDVIRFIQDDKKLTIWSSFYFMDLSAKIKFKIETN